MTEEEREDTGFWQIAKKVLLAIWHGIAKACSWYIHLFKGRPWYIKILSTIGSIILFIILYLGAVDIDLFGLFGKSPSMHTIKSTRPPQASEIYSADGLMLGKFFSENRTPVKYEDVNPVFWEALIDTEDERFYKHYGVDVPAFFAAAKDYVMHHDARGASTITQQLAKNLFRMRNEYSTGLLGKVPGLKMLVMKSKEWVTALKLEWNFSKEEILTMYANTVDFGSNAYGIKTACKTYFGIAPKDLKSEQAAVLVGMLKATTTYNPRLNPENSMRRRNVVLGNMLRHGHLTQALYDSICPEPVVLNYSVENVYYGPATYFRNAMQDNIQEWCHANGIDPYTDGLKIYTTLDHRMQEYAESNVCRRRILLNYFSEQTDHDCGNCDVCDNPPQRFDGTRYVQMALSAAKRANEDIRISTIIEILKGMRSPAVMRQGFDRLKTFGVGHDLSLTDWQDYLLQMLQMGFIEIAYNDGNKVKVTAIGDDVLYGRKPAQLCVVDHSAKEAPKKKPKLRLEIPTITIPGLPPTTGIEDPKLFEALRQLRKQCAEEEGFPPYIVFSDKVLHSLATIKPTSLAQFGNIQGIGEHKKGKYGERFVSLIQKYV